MHKLEVSVGFEWIIFCIWKEILLTVVSGQVPLSSGFEGKSYSKFSLAFSTQSALDLKNNTVNF